MRVSGRLEDVGFLGLLGTLGHLVVEKLVKLVLALDYALDVVLHLALGHSQKELLLLLEVHRRRLVEGQCLVSFRAACAS